MCAYYELWPPPPLPHVREARSGSHVAAAQSGHRLRAKLVWLGLAVRSRGAGQVREGTSTGQAGRPVGRRPPSTHRQSIPGCGGRARGLVIRGWPGSRGRWGPGVSGPGGEPAPSPRVKGLVMWDSGARSRGQIPRRSSSRRARRSSAGRTARASQPAHPKPVPNHRHPRKQRTTSPSTPLRLGATSGLAAPNAPRSASQPVQPADSGGSAAWPTDQAPQHQRGVAVASINTQPPILRALGGITGPSSDEWPPVARRPPIPHPGPR